MFAHILECPSCRKRFRFESDREFPAEIVCPGCWSTAAWQEYFAVVFCPGCRAPVGIPLDMLGDDGNKCPKCGTAIPPDSVAGSEAPTGKANADPDTRLLQDGEVFDKYRILRLLGRGGMAEVYLAEHLLLHQRCALKLMYRGIGAEPAHVKRFIREAKLAHRISHPNIVQVFDAGSDFKTGLLFLAMEYVEGRSLSALARGKRFTEKELREILRAMAEALKTLNEFHVVHRDIKPSNIMQTPEGVYKLMDFGIAKINDREQGETTLTMDQMAIGTPGYASPEQCRSAHDVDIRSDIYCLGATLYHLASGAMPFDGATPVEIILRVLQEEAVPLRKYRPDLSPAMTEFIERMMKKNPDERPSSPEELLKFLRGSEGNRFVRWQRMAMEQMGKWRSKSSSGLQLLSPRLRRIVLLTPIVLLAVFFGILVGRGSRGGQTVPPPDSVVVGAPAVPAAPEVVAAPAAPAASAVSETPAAPVPSSFRSPVAASPPAAASGTEGGLLYGFWGTLWLLFWGLSGFRVLRFLEDQPEVQRSRFLPFLNFAALLAGPVILAFLLFRRYLREPLERQVVRLLNRDGAALTFRRAGVPLDGNAWEACAPLSVRRAFKRAFRRGLMCHADDLLVVALAENSIALQLRVNGTLHTLKKFSGRDAAGALALVSFLIGRKVGVHSSVEPELEVRGSSGAAELRVGVFQVAAGRCVSFHFLAPMPLADTPESLGLDDAEIHSLREFLSLRNGVIVVGGESADERSFTVIRMLDLIDARSRKVILLSPSAPAHPADGVEWIDSNRASAGENALQTALQQSPDLLAIDGEWEPRQLKFLVNAAQNGTLVILTKKGADVSQTICGLRDVGFSGSELASLLRLVVQLHPLRRLCNICAAPAKLSEAEEAMFRNSGIATDSLRHADGCAACGFTGYRGRTVGFELYAPGVALLDVLESPRQEFTPAEIRRAVDRETGGSGPYAAGCRAAALGLTSLEEIARLKPTS